MEKKKFFTIKDKVYGGMVFDDPLIFELIQTKEFSRLKKIKQHGSSFTFENNQFTFFRYDHCLGVCYLTHLLLKRKRHNLSYSSKEKKEVYIAALLHDVGHGPFSHDFEAIVPNFIHEKYSVDIIKNPKLSIYPLLKKYGLDVDRICNLISGTSKDDWAQKLISGQLDLDRMDYLFRDQHFSSWKLSRRDIDVIIDGILVLDGKLVFKEKILDYIERILIFRFYIYEQLLWGNENFFFDQALSKAFRRIREICSLNELKSLFSKKFVFLWEQRLPTISEFIDLNDQDMVELLVQMKKKIKDKILQSMLNLVFLRQKKYDPFFSEDPQLLANLPDKERKYFKFFVNKEIDVYSKADEIKILMKSNQIKNLSEVATFLTRDICYKRKILVFLNFNKLLAIDEKK